MKFLRIPYISGSTLIETAVASSIVMIVFMIATSIMSRLCGKAADADAYRDMSKCRDSVIVAITDQRQIPEKTIYRRSWGIMRVEAAECKVPGEELQAISVSVVMKCGYLSNIYYMVETDGHEI